MENGTLIQVFIDKDLNLSLDIHQSKLKAIGVKTAKADLIVKLMRIGLNKESQELLKEEKEDNKN